MIRALEAVRDNPDGDYFISEHQRESVQGALDRLTESSAPRSFVTALCVAAQIDLRMGRERSAIKLLRRAVDIVERRRKEIPPGERAKILFDLGVAYMRLGETENCCQRWTPESCIFPVRGDGIHTQPEGSRSAIEQFAKIVQARPPHDPLHRGAAWLMHVAAMTLGEYPDGVPAQIRVSPAAFVSEQPFPRFRNIAERLGLATFGLSGGVAADDFDGDGDIDLLVSCWDPAVQLRAWKNNGDGSFSDDTKRAGILGITGGLNLVHADYDNDGDLDVLVLRGAWVQGRHPNSLLRNAGDGSFEDVTFDVGLGEVHSPTQTAAWADYDLDGDLDLYIGNEWTKNVPAPGQLFRNDGKQGFRDVARLAGVENCRYAKSVTWGDFDGDRYPDLYVSNFNGANRLYRNRGDGTFAELASKAGVDRPLLSFPSWFWDYDNDGNLDLLVHAYASGISDTMDHYRGLKTEKETMRLYRGDGRGGFEDVTARAGLDRPALPMGSNFGDLDGDGWLDFYLGTGEPDYSSLMPNLMFRNVQGEKFVDITTAGGFGHLQKGHGVVFADFDNDGDQDVFEQMGGAYPGDGFADSLYENPGFGFHWLSVRLVGRKSNRCGIGSRIRVVAEQGAQRRSIYRHVNTGASFGSSPLRQLIGLGRSDRVVALEVFWPTTGKTQRFDSVAIDRAYVVDEASDRLREQPLRRVRLGG